MILVSQLATVARYLRQEGAWPAAGRIISVAVGAIYRAGSAYLLARSLDQPVPTAEPRMSIRIYCLGRADADCLTKITYRSRTEICRRLRSNQACLVAEHDGRIVHYSWVTSQPEYAREIEKELRFDPEERYIYDCRTLRCARGHGIYPAVLARAMELARADGAHWLVALVAADNTPSLRAFDKAGFHVREEIRLRRLLWSRRHCLTRYASR
jgi:GNAT superfamily N-acetyltransferase